MHHLSRRRLLGSSAIALLMSSSPKARATIVKGGLPWKPGSADPPRAVTPGGWLYFTPREAATVEAFVDRLIPPDPQTPGGKDIGCAVFIDRQLAGPYGRNENLYMMGPFRQGTKQQGTQSPLTAAQQYRKALAALDDACRGKCGGKSFADLSGNHKDEVILSMSATQLLGSLGSRGLDAGRVAQLLQVNYRIAIFSVAVPPCFWPRAEMPSGGLRLWAIIAFVP